MPDVELTLSYQINCMLKILFLSMQELNLTSNSLEAAYLIAAKYKKIGLKYYLSQGDNLKEFAQELGAHPESIAALYRKLKAIERFPFFNPYTGGTDS